MAGGLLGVGITGLQAFQQSLNTAGQNIANAHTPGYSRQRITLQARTPQFMGSGFIGQGVKVNTTKRVVDDFLNIGLRESVSNFGYQSKFLDLANRVDLLVSDPKSGVSQGLNNFFEAMHVASYQPNSIPAREAVISSAQVLAHRIKALDQQFIREAQTINNDINENVNLINTYAQQIASLNSDIVAAMGMSNNLPPNDLLDQRDELIRGLSEVIEVTVTAQDDGADNVFIGNGLTLVIGGQYSELGTQVNLNDATLMDIVLKSEVSNQVVTDKIEGGRLGGARSFLNDLLFPSRNALGRFAISIAQTLNSQHRLGIDLDNVLGQDVFTDMNRADISAKRIVANQLNNGNAVMGVDVLPISRDIDAAIEIYGNGQQLQDVGTLTGLSLAGDLKLNGVDITTTLAGDDTLSPAGDAASSAIAIAAAINKTSPQHNISATVEPNTLFLGQFTTGAIASGEFQINGVNVVSNGSSVENLVQDINALKLQTGVSARLDQANNLILAAADGRNIQLNSNTNTPTASFTHFDLASATALAKVQRAQVKLYSELDTVEIAGYAPNNVDLSSGTYPEEQSYLTTSDYQLSYDGSNYTLIRTSDSEVIYKGSSINNVTFDGLKLKLNAGSISAGDRFTIRPTFNAASEFNLALHNSRKLAFAAPVRTDAELTNTGSGQIALDRITDASGEPFSTNSVFGNAFSAAKKLSPPIRIEFVSDTSYRVFDITNGTPGEQIGPDQTYSYDKDNQVFPLAGVSDTSNLAQNANYTFDPGYRIKLTGAPKANDVFTVQYNTDAAADNTNLIEITALQTEKLLIGKAATYSNVFSQMVSDIGTQTAATKMNLNAAESLMNQSQERRNAISGVNLDEEAANILKLQQAYQASAQVVNIAKDLFDVLMTTFGR